MYTQFYLCFKNYIWVYDSLLSHILLQLLNLFSTVYYQEV